MHLVLARPEGAKPGTKGLSLFLVPKFHFDTQTGEPGERNSAFVTGVEHKMGRTPRRPRGHLRSQRRRGHRLLLGEVHDGSAQMPRSSSTPG